MIKDSDQNKFQNQLKAIGLGLGAAILACNVLSFLCQNAFFGGVAGLGLGVVVYVMTIASELTKPEIMQPPAKLYNLTPLRVMSELKKLFSTQYFGSRKWQLDHADQESLEMMFAFKHSSELAMGDPGGGGTKPIKKEALVTMVIKLERVGEGTALEPTFKVVDGAIDFDLQDIVRQTTGLIDAALRAQEAVQHGQ